MIPAHTSACSSWSNLAIADDSELAPSSSSGNGEDRWYVVRTRPFSELRAIGNLERQGYSIFCPRVCRPVRHARKVSLVMKPVFPNYLFIALDISRVPWRSINSTRGVANLIMHGDRPQPVPRGVIESLLRHVRPDGTVDIAKPFEAGQAVRIENGPLANIIAKFERCEPDGRTRILVDLLGRVVSVVLSREALITAA